MTIKRLAHVAIICITMMAVMVFTDTTAFGLFVHDIGRAVIAFLMLRYVLAYLDKRLDINFKEEYREFSKESRAMYLTGRIVAGALIFAAVFG